MSNNKNTLENTEKQPGLVPLLRFPEFHNTKKWDKKAFSKLFEIGSGRDYKHLKTGDIPVYGSGGYMFSVNDYLYEGESACIGRKGTIDNPLFLKGKFWTVDTLFYTHSFKGCTPKFVYLLFQNINWRNFNEAGGVPSLSKKIIEQIEVVIPQPDEQQKIVDCLSSLDELITAENQKLDTLKDHKKGLMQQLFPAEGQITPQYRFPAFQNKDEWLPKELQEIGDIVTGNTPITTDITNYGGDKLFVSPADISDLRLVLETKTKLSEKGYSGTRKIPAGSTLFVCIGSTIGKVAQNKFECATNQQINSVISFKSFDKDFIYFILEHNSKSISVLAGKQAVPIINKSTFSSVKLSFPESKKEQQKIANCLSSIDDLIAAQTQKIKSLKDHKKGLMQQLFPAVNGVTA